MHFIFFIEQEFAILLESFIQLYLYNFETAVQTLDLIKFVNISSNAICKSYVYTYIRICKYI